MSAYGYGPPPPPPPPAPSGGHPSYGHAAPAYGQGRGGGSHHGRGRGGHYAGGRGDYRGSSQPAHYEYTGQPYPSPSAPPYGGSHPPAGSYPPPQPQWAPEHGHAPPPPHGHAPVPMTSNNYHPNYAPQPYPPTQYPQQPYTAPPQQYNGPYQGPPPPNQAQWNGQGPAPQGHYGNGRPRGGYNDRGAPKPPMNGPPRPGYEHEQPPAANGAYAQPYPHDPRGGHYIPPQYAPYPGPPPPGPHHQEGYYSQSGRRGRGGHRDSRGRGGYHHGVDKSRHHKSGHHDSDHHKGETPSGGKKKKRKMNTLGLTPGMESESEDDEGEEKVLIDLIGKETLNVKDIDSFLAERRKHFPTRARVEAKKAAELAHEGEDKASSLEKQADKLRRQLRKVESSIKRKREQGDEGDEMRDPTDESSDDEPEVMSTRPPVAPPPPAKKADVSKHCKYYSTGGTCGKKGKCRFVHDPEVREAAIKEREANNGRLTIQQRLILNDKEQEDLTVLQSIQYLRKKGLMMPVDPADIIEAAGTAGMNDEHVKKNGDGIPQPPPSSLLPAASASLPPPPVKREPGSSRRHPPPSIIPSANSNSTQGIKHYQGWLLRPYGSNSGKQKGDDLP